MNVVPYNLRSVFKTRKPIVLALVLGTLSSLLAAGAIARWERANHRLQFQRQTDSITTALQRSINRYTDLLLALGDFYSVSQQTVTRVEFNRFVKRALETYSGIQALEWAPVVLEKDRAAFEASLQAEYPAFQITEQDSRGHIVPVSEKPYYVPVIYLQPWLDNQPAFGYDLTSDPTRRTALETAQNTGQISASGPIKLVQENKDQFGFLVFLPIYKPQSKPQNKPQSVAHPQSHSAAARHEHIEGYLLGVFRVSDVIEESLQTVDYDIDFTLTDRTAAPAHQFLGNYDAATKAIITTPAQAFAPPRRLCPTPDDCTHTLITGGRQWAIYFTPAATYSPITPWGALSALAIGLLLTGLVARYLSQSQAELLRTQEVNALKIRLFSMASHELRTPLSTILLSAQMLENGLEAEAPSSRQLRTYTRIRAAAKRMNRLLNDLLTLARAESGKLKFSPEIINLSQFCRQLAEEVQYSFETFPEIDLIGINNNTLKVYLDPQLLRAILTNLLSNAIKYSGLEPKVTLTVSYHPHEIIFKVTDYGIGIPKPDQARLCEAFYRGKNVGDISGTGLGLSVVNACLQIHQGSLTCQSQVDQGTTFTVILPHSD